MSKKETKATTGNDGISRRDFAKTSVAAGAAAVALPGSVRGEMVRGMSARGSGKPHAGNWASGLTIPQEYYVDEARYVADEKYLAENMWLWTDHESRIPNPGDFFVFEFGRSESILIVRGQDNEVRGFYNVCRHRGSRLCRHDADSIPNDPRLSVKQLGQDGNSPVFRCPYHAWTYDTAGSLIYAYGMQDDFDPADNGLVPCHLHIEQGNIHVHLSQAEGKPAFEDAMASLRNLGEMYGMAGLKVGVREKYHVKANWKLAFENFLECYHCGPSHTSLVTTHHWDEEGTPEVWEEQSAKVREWAPNFERQRWGEEAEGGMGGMGGGDDESPYPSTSGMLNPGFVTGSLDGKAVAPRLPNRPEWTHESRVATTGHTMGYWQCYDDHIMVARFTPRDVDSTDAEIIWLVHPDAVEGRDFDPEKVKGLWHVTIQEDAWITVNNHDGIRSAAYGSGHYSRNERSLVNFMDWYMKEVVPNS